MKSIILKMEATKVEHDGELIEYSTEVLAAQHGNCWRVGTVPSKRFQIDAKKERILTELVQAAWYGITKDAGGWACGIGHPFRCWVIHHEDHRTTAAEIEYTPMSHSGQKGNTQEDCIKELVSQLGCVPTI